MIWKFFLLALAASAAVNIWQPHTVSAASRPHIIVLATGGTIAGRAASSSDVTGYQSGVIGVDTLLNAVPKIQDAADVKGEQLSNIDSKDMTDDIWRRLAARIHEILTANEADGIVVTHGTDTMEETALFLSLTVKSEKPVVLTGAMLPATARNADGPRNLTDAVRVAANPESAGKGVLVVMNGEIHAARNVTKAHTTKIDAFESPDSGPIGRIDPSGIVFERSPLPPMQPQFSAELPLPRVDILYGHEGDDGALVEAALHAGAEGIVYAGLGNGSIPAEAEKQLAKAAAAGVVVIRASRTKGGAVVPAAPSYATEGFIDSGALNPQKARVLLRLALTKTQDPAEIQKIFREFSYCIPCQKMIQ